ncbi:MAG TPA: hypothetical protein VGC16_11065, partial [Rhizomicrobium sp.]
EGQAHLAALKQISLMVTREALTLTYNDVLLLMSLSFFIALPLTLLLKRPQMSKGPSEAH